MLELNYSIKNAFAKSRTGQATIDKIYYIEGFEEINCIIRDILLVVSIFDMFLNFFLTNWFLWCIM
jgi:hypothetical protein